jgi:hypothetical protein
MRHPTMRISIHIDTDTTNPDDLSLLHQLVDTLSILYADHLSIGDNAIGDIDRDVLAPPPTTPLINNEEGQAWVQGSIVYVHTPYDTVRDFVRRSAPRYGEFIDFNADGVAVVRVNGFMPETVAAYLLHITNR